MQNDKLDVGNLAVIAITMGLFVAAVFLKGIGKDLLLEAGVLMISVKLIRMTAKNANEARAIREDLDRIVILLQDRLVARESDGAREETAKLS